MFRSGGPGVRETRIAMTRVNRRSCATRAASLTAAAREGRGTKLGDERGDVRQDSAAARRDQGQKNDRRRDGGNGSSASSVKQLAGGPPVAVMSASMAVVWPQLGVGAGGTSGANGASLVPEGPEQGLRRRPSFSTHRLASAGRVPWAAAQLGWRAPDISGDTVECGAADASCVALDPHREARPLDFVPWKTGQDIVRRRMHPVDFHHASQLLMLVRWPLRSTVAAPPAGRDPQRLLHAACRTPHASAGTAPSKSPACLAGWGMSLRGRRIVHQFHGLHDSGPPGTATVLLTRGAVGTQNTAPVSAHTMPLACTRRLVHLRDAPLSIRETFGTCSVQLPASGCPDQPSSKRPALSCSHTFGTRMNRASNMN
ncbi:hypothetical protein Purlil1_193 [Purpureocillium lilacinum]|uniref:Uncharacterized protein n=1 Tax=Purpureocillium lilacinum TaxID=33203 RepID=A0ABR0CGZ4_PURLI|nr:hypothetical protein Purlil1_193 [Purpureocillium lilacinum]